MEQCRHADDTGSASEHRLGGATAMLVAYAAEGAAHDDYADAELAA